MKSTVPPPPRRPRKPTRNGDASPPYRLNFHAEFAAELQALSGKPGRFNPRLGALFDALESDPKQYPLKRDALAGCRAAPVHYRTQAWRCVFEVDDVARIVVVLALDLHDVAYAKAALRRS